MIALSVEELAKQVIAGQWGNGEKRRENITKAGYDYDEVQTEVNRMLSGEPKQKQLKTINVDIDLNEVGSVVLNFR